MKREQEESIKNTFVTMLNKLAFMPLTDFYIEMLGEEEAEKSGPESAILKEKEKIVAEERGADRTPSAKRVWPHLQFP